MTTYVLTAIGEDRPGLVSSLAVAIDEFGGSWVDSQLALLAGTFAGIVRVDLPADRAEDFVAHLPALSREVGLRVEATVADPGDGTDAGSEDLPGETLQLRLLGQDRTGMVREVTTVLSSQRVTIDALRSWTREAPEGGGMLFEAEAEIRLAADGDPARVREALELIAAELMVDLDVSS